MADTSEATIAVRGDGATVSARFFVLGQLMAESDHGPLFVSGAHRRRLLALLASRPGRNVSVDAIVDTLWGDDPPPSAATTVRSHISRLRRSLRDADATLVEAVPGGYRLAVDPSAIDTWRFENLIQAAGRHRLAGDHITAQEPLTAAIELWHGPAYLEFRDAEFGVAEGVRLDELHLAAQEDLADSQITGGSATAAVVGLERLVRDAPGRERAWQLLMRALYASGRQHDALSAFQRARHALADLGVEPCVELRDTERQILEQHPAVAPVSGQSMLAAALRTSTALVGRVAERRLLSSAWLAAKSGSGQVRLLTGPLESGRTRLVADLAGRAIADGGAVEYARGDELLALLDHADRGGRSASSAGQFVDRLAERCRARPQVLVVDDAEYAIGPTVDLINAIASAADQLALLVLVVIDPSAGGPAVSAFSRLETTVATTIEVEPMTDDELATVVSTDGVDPSAVPAIIAVSCGLPGVARREAAAWAERTASERLRRAAISSLGATALADRAQASVHDEVLELVDARNRRDELWSARWAGRQPYRALSTYGPQDAELFVGRERLVAELAAGVLERRLVVVTGASGSGKSSLVRAGLVPLARSGRLPGAESWSTHIIVPGFDPLASLAAVDDLDDQRTCLLVVDQFEETFAAPSSLVHRFAAQLVDLARDPDLDVHVVLVVRSDAYLRVAALPLLGELAADSPILVGPPSDDELRRIVVEPARRTGASVEPALVDLIAHDVGGYEAALPLVSAALADLWERRDAGVLRCDRYVELGGLSNAVERLGTQALVDAGENHVDAIHRILLTLADVTDDGVWARRRVPVAELPDDQRALDALVSSRLVMVADDTADIVHEVVFRAWPQLATWLEQARADIVRERELASAAHTWDVEGRPDDNLWRGARLLAALEWAERIPELIPPLVADFLTAGQELNERQASQMMAQLAREQRARRRATRLLAAATVLVVIALIAGGSAVLSRNRAREAGAEALASRNNERDAAALAAASQQDAEQAAAEAAASQQDAEQAAAEAQDRKVEAEHQALVSAAVALRGTDRRLAALLAVEAHRIAPSPATQDALFGLFTSFPGIGRTVTLAEGPTTGWAVMSPDGQTLSSLDPTGVVRLIDIATGQDVATFGDPFPERSDFGRAAFSPDGRFLVAAIDHDRQGELASKGEFSTLEAWDVSTGDALFDPVAVPILVGSLTITADGSTAVVAGDRDGRILAYDMQSGELSHELPALPRPADARLGTNTVALGMMPDGRLIVTSQAGPIRFFDVDTWTETGRIDSQPQISEVAVHVAPDGGSIITGGFNGYMRFELPSGRPMWTAQPDVFCQNGDAYVPSLGVIFCGEGGGRLLEVDVDTGAVTRSTYESQSGATPPVTTPTGDVMLTTRDDSYTVWRLDGDSLVTRLTDRDATTRGVAYTDDGHLLTVAGDVASGYAVSELDLATGGSEDLVTGAIDVWFAPTFGGLVLSNDDGYTWYDLDSRSVVGVPLDPGFVPEGIEPIDHGVVAVAHGEDPAILDFEQGTVTRDVFDPPLVDVVQFDDGRFVTVTGDDELQMRDHALNIVAATTGAGDLGPGEEFLTYAVATSPHVIARSRLVRGVDLFDPATMASIGTLPVADRTLSPIFADDQGSRLIGVGLDHSVRLFDLDSLIQLGGDIPTDNTTDPYIWPAFASSAVDAGGAAIRPDGMEAAIVMNNGIAIWDLDPEHWANAACDLAGRNLTEQEWAKYVGDLAEFHATCPQGT